jgi:hypothetical protein
LIVDILSFGILEFDKIALCRQGMMGGNPKLVSNFSENHTQTQKKIETRLEEKNDWVCC